MPTVVNLKRKKRTKEWYLIYLNDGREILSYIDFIVKFKVKVGKQLTEEQIKEMKSESEVILAKEIAYRFISYKPRTLKEVSDKLKAKGFQSDLVSKVVEELKNYGFINDLEYARNFVLNKSRSKTLGELALRRELLSKGISSEIVDGVLSERENLIDEFEIALDLAQGKLKQIKSLKKRKRGRDEYKRRIYEFLLRRGFKFETINRVMREVFDDFENLTSD
jgi:regulatory protein